MLPTKPKAEYPLTGYTAGNYSARGVQFITLTAEP